MDVEQRTSLFDAQEPLQAPPQRLGGDDDGKGGTSVSGFNPLNSFNKFRF